MALSRLDGRAGVLIFRSQIFYRSVSVARPVSRYRLPRQCVLCSHYCNDAKKAESQSGLSAWFSRQYEKYETVYMNALKRFPFLHKVTTVFVKGTKQLYRDCKEGMRIRKMVRSGTPYPELTWREMYAVRMMIRDLRTVMPTLVLLSLPIPFWFYVALPVLYLFPRHLLSHQFYQPEQRIPFAHLNHYRKAKQYDSILRYLETKMSGVHDPSTADGARAITDKLKSGVPICPEDLIEIKQLFVGRFSLRFLPRHQLKRMCRVFTMWPYLQPANFLRKRLNVCIGQLHFMDTAIQKEGVETLTVEELQKVCYERGLDSAEADKEQLSKWLTDWIRISTEISAAENSLLLYSAVLLSVNHPTHQHHKKYLRQ
ncbi:LETM1 domain-containing protein 1-like [Ptychodera flava]|uniref:LETM1 domain-containing protein 1-like n=1 Tax=Ptychodera flava TaxID=63121 RepID=UPI00396A2E8D